MIITIKFVDKLKSQRKENFISLYPLKKGLNCALLATKFGVRIIEVWIIEVRIIEDALYMYFSPFSD